MFNTFSYIPFAAVQGFGRPDLKAKLDIANTVLCLVAGWLLIRSFGIEGAGISRILVSLADAAALVVFSRHILGTPFAELFPAPLRTLLLLTFLLPIGGIALSASLGIRIAFTVASLALFLGVYLKLFYRLDADMIHTVFRGGRRNVTDAETIPLPPSPEL